MSGSASNPIILYDGVCGLCNRLVQFVLKHDSQDRFRFASLQSDFAAQFLRRHGAAPEDLDTMYVVIDRGLREEGLRRGPTPPSRFCRNWAEGGLLWAPRCTCFPCGCELGATTWSHGIGTAASGSMTLARSPPKKIAASFSTCKRG